MRVKVALAGAAVYVGASAATYLYLRGRSPDNPTAPCCQSSDVFDRNADIYDRQIDLDETLMGVKLLRRWLVGKAEGDVLEVAAGTGRNLKYYHSPAVKSLTLIDTSREMLLRAYDKHKEAVEKGGTRVPVRVALADVQNLCAQGAGALQGESATRPLDNEESTKYGPALRSTTSFPPQSLFDTVVDTFGLCSCSDPLQALKEMARAVRPGGKLLLLEHGRGTWDFVNNILDANAEKHLAKWGCEWNRDIGRLVEQAGLEIESVSRWHFGTTYVMICRPKKAEGSAVK